MLDLKKAVKLDVKKSRGCPKCGKPLIWKSFTWHTGDKMDLPCLDCACQSKMDDRERMAAGAKMGGIPKQYRNETLADWVSVPGTEVLHLAGMQYAKKIRENVESGKGAIFIGAGYGTGKTKHAYYIQLAAIRAGIQTYALTAQMLMRKIRSLKDQRQHAQADQLIEKLIRVPLLIYDDLGSQKPHVWDKADVESVISERETYARATVFTSNKTEDELDQHFGGHITSRVFRMTSSYMILVESMIDMRRPENREKYGVK